MNSRFHIIIYFETTGTQRQFTLHNSTYTTVHALHCSTWTTIHYIHYTTVHALHCRTCTTLQYMHYTTVHELHYSTCTTLQYMNYTAVHALHCSTCTTLQYMHYIACIYLFIINWDIWEWEVLISVPNVTQYNGRVNTKSQYAARVVPSFLKNFRFNCDIAALRTICLT